MTNAWTYNETENTTSATNTNTPPNLKISKITISNQIDENSLINSPNTPTSTISSSSTESNNFLLKSQNGAEATKNIQENNSFPSPSCSKRITIPNLNSLSRKELLSEFQSLVNYFNATSIPTDIDNIQLVRDYINYAVTPTADFSAASSPSFSTETPSTPQEIDESRAAEDPFYIIDLGAIVKKYLEWINYLPRVKPFYAVKCNPSPAIIKTIGLLGGSFDCASKGEIATVQNLVPGIDMANEIIFANPCKQLVDMRSAKKSGVRMTTFDNEDELIKIKNNWPDAEIVMRIITDDSHSICKFSTKFGVPLNSCSYLINRAKELDLNLIGISFHVGSGCMDPNSFIKAIESAHKVFEEAKSKGFNMRLLDIGGGFPGSETANPSFKSVADAIRPVLDKLFNEDVTIIAEPGRYFACASHILCCNVYARRSIISDETRQTGEFLYYINDGVYGSFNCIIFDHSVITPKLVNPPKSNEEHLSTLFGPTCDSMDCICKNIKMPELNVGDWLYFDDFGAYTLAAGSAFNGFKTTKQYYIMRF